MKVKETKTSLTNTYEPSLFTPGENLDKACIDLQAEHFENSVDGTSLRDEVGIATANRRIRLASEKGESTRKNELGSWEARKSQIEVGRYVLQECIACEYYDDCPAVGFIESSSEIPTYDELMLQRIQLGLSKELSGKHRENVVITGGVALRIHGILRTTSDIDLDFIREEEAEVSIEPFEEDGECTDIKADVEGFFKELEEQGQLHGYTIGVKKDTENKVKLNVGYTPKRDEIDQVKNHIKIEVEYAEPESVDIDKDTEVIDGVRVYTLKKLFLNKVDTIRDRVKVRDYADLTFIAEKRPELVGELPEESLKMLQDRFDEILNVLTDDARDISEYFDDYLELPSWLRSNRKFSDVLFLLYEDIEKAIQKFEANF